MSRVLPKRIQRKRTKGWKMPENTVYVGRPTKWGNPFKVGDKVNIIDLPTGIPVWSEDNIREINYPSQAVNIYKHWLMDKIHEGILNPEELRGKNLACFCKEDEWCHAGKEKRIQKIRKHRF